MSVTQVDPAQLQGGALTRWYLRSPNEIEAERNAAAQKRYDEFFSPAQEVPTATSSAPPPSSDRQANWQVDGLNRWQGTAGTFNASAAAPSFGGQPAQPSSARHGGPSWPQPHDPLCRTCHRGGVPPLPAGALPSFRDTPTPSSGGRGKRDFPQCDIQLERDTEICTRQPNRVARAMCHESAMERYSYCKRKDGEVGWPDLFTHPDGPKR